MVFLDSLEEWQKQSALLLQARPSTARVTTKYNIPNLTSPSYNTSKTKATYKEQEDEGYGSDGQKKKNAQPRVPRATITLKTYDPASGVTLKFKTDRAADVGRTIAGLGNLGRHMAALPPKPEVKDVVMEDAPNSAPTKTPNDATSENKTAAQSSNAGAAGTSKKKKKGKK